MNNQQDITTNYFSNKKGSVTAVQGDANLDQIADVNYLLDTFFSGSPAPKGLFGYSGDLNRDILEDLKRDFFDELDGLQDELSWVYEQGFRLQLLLNGINPDDYDFEVSFAERLTETPNAKADRALKIMSVGASKSTVWEAAGLDPEQEHDCFSDLSHIAIYHNFQGIRNAFYGGYQGLDGKITQGASIADLINQKDAALFTEFDDAFNRIETSMNVVLAAGEQSKNPIRFDQIIGQDENAPEKKAALDAVYELVSLSITFDKLEDVLSIEALTISGDGD